jgi:hypothetical protein
MKHLTGEAQKVMEFLVEGLEYGGKRKKIDNSNGTFMPVHVEFINRFNDGIVGDVFSVAHYYEQNGDMMRDPDVEFLRNNGKFYPIYFRQDGAGGKDQEVLVFDIDTGHVNGYRKKLQADITRFCNTLWMPNIKEQQRLIFSKKKKEQEL